MINVMKVMMIIWLLGGSGSKLRTKHFHFITLHSKESFQMKSWLWPPGEPRTNFHSSLLFCSLVCTVVCYQLPRFDVSSLVELSLLGLSTKLHLKSKTKSIKKCKTKNSLLSLHWVRYKTWVHTSKCSSGSVRRRCDVTSCQRIRQKEVGPLTSARAGVIASVLH